MRLFWASPPRKPGEFVVLAAAETLIAGVLVVWMSLATGDVSLAAMWCGLGWLLLMRTPDSVSRGIVWHLPLLRSYTSAVEKSLERVWFEELESRLPRNLVYSPFGLLVGTLAAVLTAFSLVWLLCLTVLFIASTVAIRIGAATWGVLVAPGRAVRAIPENWREAALRTDSTRPLELVPGLSSQTMTSSDDRGLRLIQGFLDVRPATIRKELREPRLLLRCLFGLVVLPLLPYLMDTYLRKEASDPAPAVVQSAGGATPGRQLHGERNEPGDDFGENWTLRRFDPWSADWFIWAKNIGQAPIRWWGENWFTTRVSVLAMTVLLTCLVGLVTAYFTAWIAALVYSLKTPLRLVFFLPVIFYRFVLKSTILVNAPLFWVADAPFDSHRDPRRSILTYLEHPHAVLARQFSILACAWFLIKVLVGTVWNSLRPYLRELLSMLGLPTRDLFLYPWEVASAASVVLTFLIWYVASRTKWTNPPETMWLRRARALTTLSRARRIFAGYAFLWGVCRALSLVHFFQALDLEVRFPFIDWVLWPYGHPT